MTDVLEIAAKAVQMYHEMHPRPPHVTQKQAAEMLCVSAPTVGRLVKSGLLKRNEAGMIPIHQVDALIAGKKAA